MAAATATVTLTDIWHDTKRIHTIGSIAVSASPATYPANGIPVSFAGLSASDGTPLPTSNDPEHLRVDGVGGFLYVYDKTNKTLRIFESPAIASAPSTAVALSELTTGGAIPAGVSGDTISFDAIFKMV